MPNINASNQLVTDHPAAALRPTGVYLYNIDTGSDEYAIVVSDTELTSDEARQQWEES